MRVLKLVFSSGDVPMVSEKLCDAEWTLDVLMDLQNFFSANGMPVSEREAVKLQREVRNEISRRTPLSKASN